MTEPPSGPPPAEPPRRRDGGGEEAPLAYYKIRFRQQGQEFTASAQTTDLVRGEQVMVRTEQGAEPAEIVGRSRWLIALGFEPPVQYRIHRRANAEERMKYQTLPMLEQEAFRICRQRINELDLPMHLVRVERFFNGSKIIFYFTAESRVDFRELVKLLVQEFRTRVEMRQIGVRHETQITGGLGACGRELCCTTFLNKFDSVSIKMAKTQDLPLNPAKISGVCNRLLCCLTYEYETYRTMKKGMPRVGRAMVFDSKTYQVTRQWPLLGTVTAVSSEGEERVFSEEEWRAADTMPKPVTRHKGQGKKGPPKRTAADNPDHQEDSEEE